ncbi:MAG: cupin domain-containing protein [Thiotrichales bacterium]|nr:MAG: cupin domain-containing protein [Thiotrichales bacterium]
MVESGNIYTPVPTDLDEEVFELLTEHQNVRIERIISSGHKSPENHWYDQEQNEWVLVLKGEACIGFENDVDLNLGEGDHINIPAHTKHRVVSTSLETETIWLAVFY